MSSVGGYWRGEMSLCAQNGTACGETLSFYGICVGNLMSDLHRFIYFSVDTFQAVGECIVETYDYYWNYIFLLVINEFTSVILHDTHSECVLQSQFR